MSQQFKAVYFSDHPNENSNQKAVTLAFGKNDSVMFDSIRGCSSAEIRELLGHTTFGSLQTAAENEGLSIGTYCIKSLRLKSRESNSPLLMEAFSENDLSSQESFSAIHTTFRGGKDEPLHDWYPYLEGYSPGFVIEILNRFAPAAKSIYDPFAGTGTTPLTASQMGLRGCYSELNPVLQFLIESKCLALSIDDKTRIQVAKSLRTIKLELPKSIASFAVDRGLEESYSIVFGDRGRINDDQLRLILKMRTLIDELACIDQFCARYLTVAALASLIPSSNLIRRGDLRFRNQKELIGHKPDFIKQTCDQLGKIASDIEVLDMQSSTPFLISENSKHLAKLRRLDIDAVVTSPPYLNGTNYFRNTKIELWFLRSLLTSDDLATFRFKAVTAGINDVTVRKTVECVDSDLAPLIEKLSENAYDARIPQMVANYFADMNTVFGSLKSHLNRNAVVVVDIGDSAYGNTHVPTDLILKKMFHKLGFSLQNEFTLRKRGSRSGFPLRQALLVFKQSSMRFRKPSSFRPHWSKKWQRFKTELPHQKNEFAKRNWGHPLHSLCSYQGKMKPSLAHHLVETFVQPNGRFLDPFAGVGTIPFSGSLTGREGIGFEISPIAIKITEAKLGEHNANSCERIISKLEGYIQRNVSLSVEHDAMKAIRFNGDLCDYFSPGTLNEILIARRYFLQRPPCDANESLVFSSLLHILHGNRPYALSRRSHPITPYSPTGDFEYRPLVPRLRNKVARSLAVSLPQCFRAGKVLHQDATSWWNQGVDELDAIITSPPFFDSTRFYLANWMRLWFAGWEAKDFQTQPLAYVDERQKQTFKIYEPIFRQARERLKANGVFVLHLGKSKKCDMAEELKEVASPWFNVADVFAEDVDHCESHGIRDKGAVTSHQYLILN